MVSGEICISGLSEYSRFSQAEICFGDQRCFSPNSTSTRNRGTSANLLGFGRRRRGPPPHPPRQLDIARDPRSDGPPSRLTRTPGPSAAPAPDRTRRPPSRETTPHVLVLSARAEHAGVSSAAHRQSTSHGHVP